MERHLGRLTVLLRYILVPDGRIEGEVKSMLIEQIGSVVIDKSKWSGSDMYSDGPIEQEMLARLSSGESVLDILKSDTRYPILYHFSRERENLLSWYPFDIKATVLEVGAGCGALTGLLTRKCASVTAVDLSLTRCRINAHRNRSTSNLQILVMNLQQLPEEPTYDLITVIGVLEYGRIFYDGDMPFHAMLQMLHKRLKPNGKLLIAIENQFGLKYFLGAREDHNWKLFGGLEGYPTNGPCTFSKAQLSDLLIQTGFEYSRFFYPFPDYKFPRQIFADGGENMFEFIGGECPDFGEYVYRASNQGQIFSIAAKGGLMKEISNSFLVCSSKSNDIDQSTKFVQYASLRDDRYAMATIIKEENESAFVYKYPLLPSAKEGISGILQGGQLLQDRLSGCIVAPIQAFHDHLRMAYYAGSSFSILLSNANTSQRSKLLQSYRHLFNQLLLPGPISFVENTYFKKVYGDIDAPDMICISPAPVDLNFDNIIQTDSRLVVIDTEWVFDFPLPLEYILWRAMRLFCEKTAEVQDELLELLEIDSQHISLFERMEQGFRNYVFTPDSMFSINNHYKKQAKDVKYFDLIHNQLIESYRRIGELEHETKASWDQLAQKAEGERLLQAQLADSYRRISELEPELKASWDQLAQKAEGEKLLQAQLNDSYRRIGELEHETKAAWDQLAQKAEGEKLQQVQLNDSYRRIGELEHETKAAWDQLAQRAEGVKLLQAQLNDSYRSIGELEHEIKAAWDQFAQKAEGEKLLQAQLNDSYRRIGELEDESKAAWDQLNKQKSLTGELILELEIEKEKIPMIRKDYTSIISKYENMLAVKITRKLKRKDGRLNDHNKV